MHVHKRIKDFGIEWEIVSGITSFCAAAAVLGETLCERDEALHIIPATYMETDELLELSGCKVLMKSAKAIMDVKDKLKDKKASLVERATMSGQKIYKDINDLTEPTGYFSLIIVPPSDRK